MAKYDELIDAMPKGSFYGATGRILPFQDAPHVFLFENGTPNTVYGLFVNDVYRADITTDGNGEAIVSVTLERGRNDLKLENDDTGQVSLLAFTDVRDYATWHAAYGEVLEALDANIEDIALAPKLQDVTPPYIEEVHGQPLRQPNDLGTYIHETYRHLLRQLRQSYRIWGAREAGLRQVVSAITSTVPLVVPDAWRAHWILGTQLARNGFLQEHARGYTTGAGTSTALPNINLRSLDYVRQAFGSNNAVVLSQPNSAKRIELSFDAGWPGTADVTITGLRPDGTEASETIDGAPSSVVEGTTVFRYITRVEVLTPSGAGVATLRTFDAVDTLAVFTSAQPLPIAQPPVAQLLTVTFAAAWPGGNNVVVTGLRPGGGTVDETFVGVASTTVTGLEVFERVYTVTLTAPAPGSFASVGVAESAFVTVEDVGDYNILGGGHTLLFNNGTDSLTWDAGLAVPVPDDGTYELRTPSIAADFVGLAVEPSPNYTFGNEPRLRLNVDTRGDINIVLPPTPTASVLRDTINQALFADPRYDAAGTPFYGSAAGTTGVASVLTGVGYIENVIRLTSPTADTQRHDGTPTSITAGSPTQTLTDTSANFPLSVIGQLVTVKNSASSNNGTFRITARPSATSIQYINATGVVAGAVAATEYVIAPKSSIVVLPGRFSPTRAILGYPRQESLLTVAAAPGDTDITVTPATAARLPGIGSQLRIGRFERTTGVAGEIETPLLGTFLAKFNDATYTPQESDIGGYVYITTVGVNQGVHRIVGIDPSPALGTSITIKHEYGDYPLLPTLAVPGFAVAAGLSWRLEGAGELVTVAAKTGALVELEEPIGPNNYAIGAPVELDGDMPIRVDGRQGDGSLLVRIDTRFKPTSGPSDTLTIEGENVPDGWQLINATADFTFPGFYDLRRLLLTADGVGPVRLEREVPDVLQYRGFQVRVTFQVQHSIATAQSFRAAVSFDGSTYSTGASVLIDPTVANTTSDVGSLAPTMVTDVFTVPFDATNCRVRLEHVGGSTLGQLIFVDRCAVTITLDETALSANNAALFLGAGTTPRNDHRTYFGKLLYVWSPNELNERERIALGVPPQGGASTPAEPGHIDYVLPAHTLTERFDVTEYVTGVPLNLFGSYTDLDWTAATKDNMIVGVATPARLSYVLPERVSAIVGETLAPSGGGVCTLAETSDMYGTFPQNPDGRARLYKDGVPLPDTAVPPGPVPWIWTDVDEITIDPAFFTLGSVYTFDYNRLIHVEATPIDLGASFADYLWFLDAAIYRRTTPSLVDSPQTVQVTFADNLQARVAVRSDEDKSTSQLVRDNGREARVVPIGAWRWLSPTTLQISASEFSADALYSLTYNGQAPDYDRPVEIILEGRSAASLVALAAATYATFDISGTEPVLVDQTNRFHQFRVFLRNVTGVVFDTTVDPPVALATAHDVTIAGLGLKGIHLYGAAPSAPGIIYTGDDI